MPGDPEVTSLDTELTRLEVVGAFWFLFVFIHFAFSGERLSFFSSFILLFSGERSADGAGLPPLRHLPRDRPAELARARRDGQHEGEAFAP